MKDFLLALFYQIIGAVEAAVIIGGIVWLAKRKDEKDERKPNPDFTPPPEKKMPAPPTTGTNVIEPKPKAVESPITQCEYCRFYTGESPDCGLCDIWNERVWAEMTCIEFKPKVRTDNRCFDCKKFSWMKPSSDAGCYLPFCNNISCFLDDDPHEFSCSNHAKMEQKEINMRETIHEDEMRMEDAKERKYDKVSRFYSPFSNLTREQVLEGLDRYINGFSSNDLLDRVENEMKRIKDDQRTGTHPIQSFIAEVRGGPGNEVMGTVTAKSAEELEEKLKALSGTLDRTDKKPVTPERLKEAGFETEPVTVSKPMSRECKNCRHFQKFGDGEFGRCNRNETPSAGWMTCGMFFPVDGPIISCGSCLHFVPDGDENVRNTGYCGEMDMATVRNYGGCWKYAKKESARPAPLETVNVFNPAEESVERYEARTAQLPHYCGNCIAHRQEKFNGESIHMCMRHKVWLHNQERWNGGCDAWEPSPAICKLYKEWADGFCSSCKYFEPEEPGQKRGMGLCARNDEIKLMGQSCAGYARKGELPKYLERQPMERQEPLGTITTH